MNRVTLLASQLLVAVLCILVWHLLTTIPVGGKPLFPPFFFSTPARCRSAHRQMVFGRHDLAASVDHACRSDARFRHRLRRRDSDRLLVRASAARRRRVRSLREGCQRVAAYRAGADFHALVRARHLVEGRARCHARVLHRVLQCLSGREGSEPDGAGQCPHARHERAAIDAACLLALGFVVDVLVAAYFGRLRCRGRGGGRISRLGRGPRLL